MIGKPSRRAMADDDGRDTREYERGLVPHQKRSTGPVKIIAERKAISKWWWGMDSNHRTHRGQISRRGGLACGETVCCLSSHARPCPDFRKVSRASASE